MKRQKYIVILFLIVPVILTGGVLAFSGNPSDGIRLALLSLPGILLLYNAMHKTHLMWKISSIFWWLLFWIDSILRSTTWFIYNSDNDAHFIVQAIANTSYQEATEFLQFHSLTLGICLSIFLLFAYSYFLCVFKILPRYTFSELFKSNSQKLIIIMLSVLVLIGYLGKPNRALHPALYWSDYYSKITSFEESIKKHKDVHQEWLHNAKTNLVVNFKPNESQTHVLIITDSVTSKNLGVCGYPRNTTPELQKYSSTFRIFCNAYSPAASTIDSLKMMLTEGSLKKENLYASESILAYAQTAGFKTYWISNQNDSYISSLFGSFVDNQTYTNHRSGRSSNSLDENILPFYERALQDTHPKKLIIVHLLGSHPNYQLRYPDTFSKFTTESNDMIEQQLEKKNISFWTQQQRNYYDNSIAYQDWLIDRFFRTFQKNDTTTFSSFIFVSDHGNEVGHEKNYAGHSPNTKAGYQVPLIVWYKGIKNTGVNLNKLINTADLDTSLMALMRIDEKGNFEKPNLFKDNYIFRPSSNWPYWD